MSINMLFGASTSYFILDLIFCLFRFTGTIVGVGSISAQWPDSKWRSLKVAKSFMILSLGFWLNK